MEELLHREKKRKELSFLAGKKKMGKEDRGIGERHLFYLMNVALSGLYSLDFG